MNQRIKTKNIVLIVILSLVLLFPFIEKRADLIQEEGLHGHFKKATKPTFSWADWMDRNFQGEFDNWLEQSIGLRPFFVNVYNQYRYSLFNQISAAGSFLGKNKLLYQTSYLMSYMGYNFIGYDEINESVSQMKQVQDALEEQNKLFLYVIAPGKAFYYPEYLPDSVDQKNRKTTNYKAFADALKQTGVNHIDFLDFFKKAKDTTEFSLYPRTGTHWSGHGVVLVCDSLLRYIEHKTKYDLVDYEISSGELTSKTLRHTDEDIEKGLNLAFDIPDWKMHYPELSFGDTTGKDMPTILDIGDSYNQSFWGFYPFFQNVFTNKSRFWYYYRGAQWPTVDKVNEPHLRDIDLPKKLEEYDIVLIVATEANLHYKGYGFVKDAYLHITESGKALEEQRQREINSYIRTIKKNPEWLKSVEEKAIKKGIGLEEMIRKDATWMVDRKKK